MESKGLGKIRYSAQTSCSLIERLGQEPPLTGTADLELFPVKSRNKSNKRLGVIRDLIDSGYHITHPNRKTWFIYHVFLCFKAGGNL